MRQVCWSRKHDSKYCVYSFSYSEEQFSVYILDLDFELNSEVGLSEVPSPWSLGKAVLSHKPVLLICAGIPFGLQLLKFFKTRFMD